jgi:hypothetical protein
MPNSNDERTVGLIPVDSETAQEKLGNEGAITGIADAVINFTEINDYTTFKAEYAFVGEDLVIHFFLTKEMTQTAKNDPKSAAAIESYWLTMFPRVLNDVGQEYFKAKAPRLQAKYTEELASWWFKAQGYKARIDPDAFAEGFLEALDQALEQ